MNYISDSFHVQNVLQYSLYVKSAYKHNQIVVVDEDKRILAYFEYGANTSPSREVLHVLSFSFSRVNVVLPHQDMVWIPTDVKEKETIASFLPFFYQGNVESIQARDFNNLDISALFQFDQVTLNRWKQLFHKANFVPVFEIVLNQAMDQIYNEHKVLGVHIYDGYADLFLFVEGGFKFYNTFEVDTVDDLSYHVLHLFQSFEIDGSVDKILLSGANMKSDWARRLQLYTPKIEILKSKNDWKIGFEEMNSGLEKVQLLIDSDLCV